MKLEIKHLVSYLPYGLKMSSHGRIYTLTGFIIELATIVQDKPILRPLSDLKDDSFIDINNQYPNTPNWDYYKEDWIVSGKNLSDTIIEYCVMQWLIENHFDVFGLIEAGLAIDINTLDQG